jgi:polysaccharide pyruvyl transferase WcaK-like protein
MKRTAVRVFGASLDGGNLGVRALAVSVIGLLNRACAEVDLAFHYGHAQGGLRSLVSRGRRVDVKVYNCRMSPRSAAAEHILLILALAALYRIGIRGPARRNAWLRSLLDADVVADIRGGDSFSDIYGLGRFVTGSLPLLTVAVLGRPYHMLPQTYGPFRLPVSRWLAATLLRNAATILTRDRNCLPTVQQLSGRSALYCPDVAFTLEALPPRHLEFSPEGFSLDTNALTIGINISGLLYMGGYTGRNMFGLRSEYRVLMDGLVERVLASTTARILIVPHVSGEQEQEACASLLQSAGGRYPGRVFMLSAPLDERETKWVIGRMDFFVGARMHACIAALSQGVPAVGLAYSDKFLGVFESAGVGSVVIDLRKMEQSEVIDKTLSAFERRAALQERLLSRIAGIQDEVEQAFRGLLMTPIGTGQS